MIKHEFIKVNDFKEKYNKEENMDGVEMNCGLLSSPKIILTKIIV